MRLPAAAVVFGISPEYLGKLVRDAQRPAKQRKFAHHTHEHFLTRFFAQDRQGSDATRGRFEWHIEDWRVRAWKRDREIRMFGATDRAKDIAKGLAKYL